MIPSLVLLGLGRRLALPLPIFLLWPLWLAGWIVWLGLQLIGLPAAAPLRLALLTFANLSGLVVEVESSHFRIRFV